jgi:hypothetical protein
MGVKHIKLKQTSNQNALGVSNEKELAQDRLHFGFNKEV